MKIGITSLGLERWAEKRYRKLKAWGFSCVDYNMADADGMMYRCSEQELMSMLLKEKQLIEEAGIEISQVHGPFRYPPQDSTAEERAELMDKMKVSIRGTALLGCKNWVFHPFMPFGINDMEKGKEKETWDLSIKLVSELLEEARKYDITVCIENMPLPQFSLSAPSALSKLVGAVNDEHFKICLDTGHAAIFPALPLGDVMRECKEDIRVLHVHDNNGLEDWHRMPYDGVVDWRGFGAALRETEFEGAFSLEYMPPFRLPLIYAEDMYTLLAKISMDITR